MLTPIDMKEWEKICREKTGLGFETFKTAAHCEAETLDALLNTAPGSTKGTMYFDWLMEYLSLVQSGKSADAKTVVDDIDVLTEMLGITPEAFEQYCGKNIEDAKTAFQTPLTEREQLLFRILSLKDLLGSLHNRAASIEMLKHRMFEQK